MEIIGTVPGKDLNRMFCSFLGVFFQGCGVCVCVILFFIKLTGEKSNHSSSSTNSFKNVGHPNRSDLTFKIGAGKKALADDGYNEQYGKCQTFILK